MKVRRGDLNDELGVRPELLGHAEATTEYGDLTEAEKRELRRERRARLARKVRLGFREEPLP